jgi:hypothetical protein
MKTNWKKVGTFAGWVFLAGAGLAIADLVFEGNSIEGVQVIAGKNSSTGKTLVPKVDPTTGGLTVTGTVTTGDTNLGAKADSSATTDTGTFSLIALTKRIATHLTRVWQGPQASCAHYRGTTTSVSAGSSGTSIDAGATGTVYWLAASNLSRTYDIQISADTGTFRVPPSGSVTLSNPGAATADSITVATNCTGCGGAATNVTVLACDDD